MNAEGAEVAHEPTCCYVAKLKGTVQASAGQKTAFRFERDAIDKSVVSLEGAEKLYAASRVLGPLQK
jgi:hypothetical protein